MFDPQKIRPPQFSAFFLLLAVFANWTLKPESIIFRPWNWFGVVILLAGIILMGRAHGLFKKKGTPVPHNETPTGVVTDGVYRYTRNPMYVAGALIFFGIAVIVGTWPFFLAWLLIGGILHFIVIPWEEKGWKGFSEKSIWIIKIKQGAGYKI